MSEQKPESTDLLGTAARRRMEHWLLSPELRAHMQVAGDERKPKQTGPWIALSRETGSGGTEIAGIAGELLGWDVLDKQILDFMAQRYGMPRDILEIVDEKRANWVHNLLGTFIDPRLVSREKYVVHLERIVCLAALHGKVVFVGRSAHAHLPRDRGLVVRVIAPKEQRIVRVMERRKLSRREATAVIDETDAARREFCRQYFHYAIEEPLQYDLVLNTAHLSTEQAARIVVQAYREARGEGAL